jgi:hypothetical protein
MSTKRGNGGTQTDFEQICEGFLQRCSQEGEDLLQLLVTSDETCVHHYEPFSKRRCTYGVKTLHILENKRIQIPTFCR